MNVLNSQSPFWAIQTDPESFAPASVDAQYRLRWSDVYLQDVHSIPAVEFQPRSGNLLFQLQGWGFSDDNDPNFYNNVYFYDLENPNDPDSPAVNTNTDLVHDCLSVKNQPLQIKCFAIFQPRGHYLAEVAITTAKEGQEVSLARRVGYECSKDGYQEVDIVDGNGQVFEKGCFQKPFVSEINPTEAVSGSPLSLFGDGFGPVGTDPSQVLVLVGGVACDNVILDATSVQCTLGNHFGEDNVTVGIEVTHRISYLARPGELFTAKVSSVVTVEFSYALALNLMQIDQAAQSLTLEGRGFATADQTDQQGAAVENRVSLELSSGGQRVPCSILSVSESQLVCNMSDVVHAWTSGSSVGLVVETWSDRVVDGNSAPQLLSTQILRGSYCGAGAYSIVGGFLHPDISLTCPASPDGATATISPSSMTQPDPRISISSAGWSTKPTLIPTGPSTHEESQQPSAWMFAGASVGALLVVAVAAFLLLVAQRRRRRRHYDDRYQPGSNNSNTNMLEEVNISADEDLSAIKRYASMEEGTVVDEKDPQQQQEKRTPWYTVFTGGIGVGGIGRRLFQSRAKSAVVVCSDDEKPHKQKKLHQKDNNNTEPNDISDSFQSLQGYTDQSTATLTVMEPPVHVHVHAVGEQIEEKQGREEEEEDVTVVVGQGDSDVAVMTARESAPTLDDEEAPALDVVVAAQARTNAATNATTNATKTTKVGAVKAAANATLARVLKVDKSFHSMHGSVHLEAAPTTTATATATAARLSIAEEEADNGSSIIHCYYDEDQQQQQQQDDADDDNSTTETARPRK